MLSVQSMPVLKSCLLGDMLTSLFRGQIEFDIGAFFEPYVRQWLINTDSKTGQWVEAVSKHSFSSQT